MSLAQVWVREVYPSHMHDKGPILPLDISLIMAKYHGTINATRSSTTTSGKITYTIKKKFSLIHATADM